MKKIIICADDFAQNESISRGIIELIERQRLSATSCMTNLDNWPKYSLLLKNIKDVDLGVHLNFTHGKPLSKPLQNKFQAWPTSILSIIKHLLSGKLCQLQIESEIELQLNQFEEYAQRTPDFIDGHQHLHHFPIIRTALLNVYMKKYGMLKKKPYIRISSCNTTFAQPFLIKKKIIEWTGAQALKKQLVKQQLPFNHNFGGIYPFNKKHRFANLFTKELTSASNNTLLMCHPAYQSNDRLDPIRHYRYQEFKYLIGDDFKQSCIKNNIQITRFNQT